MSRLRNINNYFGDMDLFLLDLILKGKIDVNARILDAGCGEGRNAIYFIQEGYNYTGIDADKSKIELAQYMANNIPTSKAKFEIADLRSMQDLGKFEFIICSRVLHFATSEADFFELWNSLTERLTPSGIIYVSMDSIIDNSLGVLNGEGKYEFPDGAIRFSITESIYNEIKKGFEPIEPLKTLVQNKTRAQSFFTLKKT